MLFMQLFASNRAIFDSFVLICICGIFVNVGDEVDKGF